MVRIFITLIFFGFFCPQVLSQKLLISEKESSQEYRVKIKKITAIGTRDGRVFEGKVHRRGRMLIMGTESIALSDVGFIEAKKFRPEKVAAFPLIAAGTLSFITGIALAAVATEGEDDTALQGAVGVGLMATGAGLVFLGRKIAPRIKEVKVFHIKDWEFSWR